MAVEIKLVWDEIDTRHQLIQGIW